MESLHTLLDPRHPDVRIECSMARAEYALRAATMAQAEQLAAIHETLVEARAFPEIFVGPSAGSTQDAVAFAERAAVADLAVRLGLAEQTVRAQAEQARVLRLCAPRVWSAFRAGEVPAANARVVAELAATLPEAAWKPFEDAILEAAAVLATARFRARARSARERVQPQEAAALHRITAQERRVWVDHDIDGMSWLTAYLPSAVAQRATAHIDRSAASLLRAADETRTLAQLRADVAGDLLAGVLGSAAPHVGVSVGVLVPVLTLLGGDQPATLEGYGPIDAATAREMAGHAPSFFRILTDPISGTVLDVDRSTYRVPADLKRWLELRDQTCAFSGCGRRARDCDVDHTIDWAFGGTTSADNLAHLCRHHHRLKHHSRWTAEHGAGGMTWTSPTGAQARPDPPPPF
ncbi:hypothetical protein IWX81_000774 [Salinibacterium sp. CAN_S4]|uniref:HNH endonuclease signature motif containing protein n=1 Tax=Salinibacterium sp. CAN_S4 TaxID=2787727 RepID=UPI0018F01CFC